MAKAKKSAKSVTKPKAAAKPAPESKGAIRIPKGARYDEKLPCKIPEAEVHKAGADLASCIRQRAVWLEKRKADNAKAREERAYFDQRIEELGEAIEEQSVTRRVPCQDYLVTRGGKPTIEIVRLDTNEVVTTREPTSEELQEGLFAGDKPAGKKGRKGKGDTKPDPEPPFGRPHPEPAPPSLPNFGEDDEPEPADIKDPDLG